MGHASVFSVPWDLEGRGPRCHSVQLRTKQEFLPSSPRIPGGPGIPGRYPACLLLTHAEIQFLRLPWFSCGFSPWVRASSAGGSGGQSWREGSPASQADPQTPLCRCLWNYARVPSPLAPLKPTPQHLHMGTSLHLAWGRGWLPFSCCSYFPTPTCFFQIFQPG